MKLIGVDRWHRDSVRDSLVETRGLSAENMKNLAKTFNSDPDRDYQYKVVADDYPLNEPT